MDGSVHTEFGENGVITIDQLNLTSVELDEENSIAYFLANPVSNVEQPKIGSLDLQTGIYETQVLDLDPDNYITLTYFVRDDEGRFLYTGFEFDEMTLEPVVFASRLNSDFSLDTSFGVDGYWKSISLGETWNLGMIRLCVDHNHQLFINYEVNYVTTITKLLEDGTEDTSFSLAPEATATGSVGLNADMQIGADNAIYIVNNGWSDQHIIKLNNDGSLFTSFANDGVLAIPQPYAEYGLYLQRVQIDDSGNLIVIGYLTDMMTGYGQGKYLLKLSEDGIIDPDYGQSLQVTTYNDANTFNFSNSWTSLQSDGKLLCYEFIVNWVDQNTVDYDVMLTRYLSDGLDNTTEFANENDILVYPNPANELLTIVSTADLPTVRSCDIFDATGKLVYQVNSIQRPLDIANLTDGMYTIRIVGDNQLLVTRFVKN
jgi:hypothetical protein